MIKFNVVFYHFENKIKRCVLLEINTSEITVDRLVLTLIYILVFSFESKEV